MTEALSSSARGMPPSMFNTLVLRPHKEHGTRYLALNTSLACGPSKVERGRAEKSGGGRHQDVTIKISKEVHLKKKGQ